MAFPDLPALPVRPILEYKCYQVNHVSIPDPFLCQDISPVRVHLDTFSHVIVDNQADILHVNSWQLMTNLPCVVLGQLANNILWRLGLDWCTSACNICCHQDVLSSFLQPTANNQYSRQSTSIVTTNQYRGQLVRSEKMRKIPQSKLSLLLSFSSMQCGSIVTHLEKFFSIDLKRWNSLAPSQDP